MPVEEEELEKNYDSSKPSVLIIDDNADIRLYVHGLLHADYAVIEAADGSEGIRKAMHELHRRKKRGANRAHGTTGYCIKRCNDARY